MTKLLTLLLAGLAATTTFAASHSGAAMPEAMKSGDAKAQAAAQDKVEKKAKGVTPSTNMPEAMKPGSEKAQAAAEKNAKPKVGKKNSTDEQMARDAKKL